MTDRYRATDWGLGGRRGPSGGGDPLYPPGGGGGAPGGGAGGETSLSSIASPCSQTAPFFPARRRPGEPGSWRRRRCAVGSRVAAGPAPAGSGVQAPPVCPGPSGVQASCGQPHRLPGGPGGVSHGTGGVCPAPGGGPPHGRGPSGRLLRHHPRLPVRLRDRLAAEGPAPAHRT